MLNVKSEMSSAPTTNVSEPHPLYLYSMCFFCLFTSMVGSTCRLKREQQLDVEQDHRYAQLRAKKQRRMSFQNPSQTRSWHRASSLTTISPCFVDRLEQESGGSAPAIEGSQSGDERCLSLVDAESAERRLALVTPASHVNLFAEVGPVLRTCWCA